MTSIRKFLYAGVLALSALSVAPALSSAQESHGAFTLPHDVSWQNVVVPAGEYRFSFEPDGAMGMLKLTKMSGTRTGFILMVTDTDESRPSDTNRLVLKNTSQGSYVSTMQLAQFGMTLHFTAPKLAGKEIASAATSPAPRQ